MTRRPLVPTITLALMLTLTAGLVFGVDGEKDPDDGSDDGLYVVVMTEHDRSEGALFDRYRELTGSWEELARFNLLRNGQVVEIPRAMLESRGVLAQVASSYGDAEVKRSFDDRFIPVVPHLLLREGDELRTWRGSGVRILFEDGNYVFVGSQSKVKIVSLGERNVSAASRLEILLKEGSVWSQIEKKLRGRFEIRTTTANTIIRGTDFRVKVEPSERTRLEVLSGHVEFEAGNERISVGSQHGAVAGEGGDPLTAIPLPPPPAPLRAPGPQEVIRRETLNQMFEWTPVASASAYRFVIARDRQFFDRVIERRVVGETSVRIQNLGPGTYFWRVSSETAAGFEGSPTESRYFVFVEAQP